MGLTDLPRDQLLEIACELGVEGPQRFRLEDLDNMTPDEIRHFRAVLETDFCAFCRWVFPFIRGVDFIWAAPQILTYRALRGIERGLTKRLIINEPPRFGKTELVEVLWPAWHIIRNPKTCWLVICASDDLVRLNSATVRDIIGLPEVQALWPKVSVSPHTNDKGLWMTSSGGYFRAVSIGGQITGFGAGRLNADWFAGALILGDPLKAQDARSVAQMVRVSQTYTSTIKSRVNDKRTPIICEAQRLHDADPSGFLLSGGSGERWHHAVIPGVVVPEEIEKIEARYKTDWSYGIPLQFDLKEGYVWPLKYDEESNNAARVDLDAWTAQIIQNPQLTEGTFFRVSWFRRFEYAEIAGGLHGNVIVDGERVLIEALEVFADTAQKTKEVNDYSVFQLWARDFSGNIYLIDQIRGKWEAPELLSVSKAWLEKYEDKMPRRYGWRFINIEDKSSGTGLIQQLERVWGSRVNGIPRATDKVSRALGVTIPLQAGKVYIPRTAPWLPEYLDEFANFSKYMTHAHDDQIDPTIDAITYFHDDAAGDLYRQIV